MGKADSFIAETGQTFICPSEHLIGSQVADMILSFSQWLAPSPVPASAASVMLAESRLSQGGSISGTYGSIATGLS